MDYSLAGVWSWSELTGLPPEIIVLDSTLDLREDGTAARSIKENGVELLFQSGRWQSNKFASPKQLDFIWDVVVVDGEVVDPAYEATIYLQSGRLLQIAYSEDYEVRPQNFAAAHLTLNYAFIGLKNDELEMGEILDALIYSD